MGSLLTLCGSILSSLSISAETTSPASGAGSTMRIDDLPSEVIDLILDRLALADEEARRPRRPASASDGGVVDAASQEQHGRWWFALRSMAALSCVNTFWAERTASYRFSHVKLTNRSVPSLRYFVLCILPARSSHIRRVTFHPSTVLASGPNDYRPPLNAWGSEPLLTLRRAKELFPTQWEEAEGSEVHLESGRVYTELEEGRGLAMLGLQGSATVASEEWEALDWHRGGYELYDPVKHEGELSDPLLETSAARKLYFCERIRYADHLLEDLKRQQLFDLILRRLPNLQSFKYTDVGVSHPLLGVQPLFHLASAVDHAHLRTICIKLPRIGMHEEDRSFEAVQQLLESAEGLESVKLTGVELSPRALDALVGLKALKDLVLDRCELPRFHPLKGESVAWRGLESLELTNTANLTQLVELLGAEGVRDTLKNLKFTVHGVLRAQLQTEAQLEEQAAAERDLSETHASLPHLVYMKLASPFPPSLLSSLFSHSLIHTAQFDFHWLLTNESVIAFLDTHKATLKAIVVSDLARFCLEPRQAVIEACRERGVSIRSAGRRKVTDEEGGP